MYNHYIKTNENNEITKAFSDAYEQPTQDSILYAESDIRQFHVEIKDINGFYVNKYIDGDIVLIPEEERGTATERYNIKVLQVTEQRANEYFKTSDRVLKERLLDVLEEGRIPTKDDLTEVYEIKEAIKIKYPMPEAP